MRRGFNVYVKVGDFMARGKGESQFGWDLRCRECKSPLSVYYARHYTRDTQQFPVVLPNFGDAVIKAKCPDHGPFKARFNNTLKTLWMDNFARAMHQCMECEKIGTIGASEERGAWIYFQIECPTHGLTEAKTVVTPLFKIAQVLVKQAINYETYMQRFHPEKYVRCEFCGHMIAPGSEVCEECGEAIVDLNLDW
jgi:hypothetical protein